METPNLIPYEYQIQIASILTNYAMAMENHALTLNKPHMLYKPKIYKDGDEWFALYGENIQEGVCGMGKNPGEAMLNFDNAWDKIAAQEKGASV
jgi:hypothetical protein